MDHHLSEGSGSKHNRFTDSEEMLENQREHPEDETERIISTAADAEGMHSKSTSCSGDDRVSEYKRKQNGDTIDNLMEDVLTDIFLRLNTNTVECKLCANQFQFDDTKKNNLIQHIETVHQKEVKTKGLGLGIVKNRSSLVWKHFYHIGQQNVQCRWCDHQAPFTKNKTTSNMLYHLRLKHPSKFELSKQQQDTEVDASASITSRRNVETHAQINSSSAFVEEEMQDQVPNMSMTEICSTGTNGRSPVWKHFIHTSHQHVKCRLCEQQVGYNLQSKSTTGMLKHLKVQHPLEFEQSQMQLEMLVQREKSKKLEHDKNKETARPLTSTLAQNEQKGNRSLIWRHFSKFDGHVKCKWCTCKFKWYIGASPSNMWYHMKAKHPNKIANANETRFMTGVTKPSLVWKHFYHIGQQNVQCRWCDHQAPFTKNKTTSNMLYHLRQKHPSKFELSKQQQDTEVDASASITSRRNVETHAQINSSSAFVEEEMQDQVPNMSMTEICSTGTNGRSPVWKHFIHTSHQHVKCRLCEQQVGYNLQSKSTTGMLKHLKVQHPLEFEQSQMQLEMLVQREKSKKLEHDKDKERARPLTSTLAQNEQKGNRSLIWRHFSKFDGHVKCKWCTCKLTWYIGAPTSNMWYHMKVKHPNKMANANETRFMTGVTKPSLIWKHFLRLGNHVRCKLCMDELKYCKSTSSAWKHLKVKHPINFARLQQTPVRAEEKEVSNITSAEHNIEADTMEQTLDSLPHTNSTELNVLPSPQSQSVAPLSNVVSSEGRSVSEGMNKKIFISKAAQVWKHFIQLGNKDIKCKWCAYQFKNKWGSVSNMSKHLARTHPYIESDLEGTTDGERENVSVSVISKSKQRKAARIPPFEWSKHGKLPLSQRDIDQCILDYIVRDLQPLAVVEDQGFQRLIKSLRPDYDMISSFRLTKILPERYREEKEWLINEEFRTARNVSISTDCWTSHTNGTYITITAHYLNSDWEVKSHVLTTRSLDTSTDNETASLKLQKIFNDFGIESKVKTYVTGLSVKIPNISEVVHAKHQLCFSQTLNMMIKDSLYGTEQISLLTNRVRNIVLFFDSSSVAKMKLSEILESEEKFTSELKIDEESQWSSTYVMLCTYLKQHDEIERVLSDTESISLCLDSEEVKLAKEAVETLEPLFEITSELSSEKHTPASKIIPILKYLLRATSKNYFALAVKLNNILQQMFDETKDLIHLQLATLLDPRFKVSGFPSGEYSSKAIKTLRQKAEVIMVSPHGTVSKARNDNGSASQMEIRHFLASPTIGKDNDPYIWWKVHGDMLPRLAQIARDVLYIPATSIPRAGGLISQRRAYLNGEELDMVMFLNNNTNTNKTNL